MSLRWEKMGRVFCPSGQSGWIHSHAQVPSPLRMNGFLRIYFSTRPEPGISTTTFLDVDETDPTIVRYIHHSPVMKLGTPGTFDEHGIMPSQAFWKNGLVHLYYTGWQRQDEIPYRNWTGIAVSHDEGNTFTRVATTPVLGPTATEIDFGIGLTTIQVKDRWVGFYASGSQWIKKKGRQEPLYHLCSATSSDGIHWERNATPLFPQTLKTESATQAALLYWNGVWHMWFCYRGLEDFRDGADAYRIGYASSLDLNSWTRADSLSGTSLSATGWDSLMMAYPNLVTTPSGIYLFYCGNGFGREGFGVARLWDGETLVRPQT